MWAGAGSPPPAALQWSQIPWERDRNYWGIPGMGEVPGKGQKMTCHPGRLIQGFQGEELGEQYKNLALWHTDPQEFPRDGPPAPPHPDPQRVQTGQWVCPTQGQDIPLTPRLHIPRD